MATVTQILFKHGPALTSQVAQRLRQTGLSAAAARQRLSRLPSDVRVLRGISFPKRARFIYLESQFGREPYWAALIKAIKTTNPAYATAIAGMQARGGIVPVKHFDIVSGAPVRQSRQVSSSTILQRLSAIGLANKVDIPGHGECAVLVNFQEEANPGGLKPRLLTENVLLGAVRDWGGRMNMASPHATRIRDEDPAPQFATFKFDLCGPSYLRPLVRLREGKADPGFLVADVVIGATLDEERVAPFVRKCEMLSHLKNVRPFIPMLIADNFTPEALRACRAKGIIATRPATLFGDDVGRALADLFQTLSNAAAVAATNPDRLESLFNRLTAIEGSAGNLRGALFEMIVGHLVKQLLGGSIDMGFVVTDPDTNEGAEIDVRLVNERRVVIYECKGHQPASQVSQPEVEDWLKRCVPRIYKYHRSQERFQSSTLCFEFWTCGTFHPNALITLKDAASRITKYKIAWKDGLAIREFAKDIDKPGIRKILDEHYFNHPVAKMAKPLQRRLTEGVGPIVAPAPEGALDLQEGIEAAE